MSRATLRRFGGHGVVRVVPFATVQMGRLFFWIAPGSELEVAYTKTSSEHGSDESGSGRTFAAADHVIVPYEAIDPGAAHGSRLGNEQEAE
jgi:hypothetical protein